MQSSKPVSQCSTREQLESYARGMLHGPSSQACEEHLEGCGDCQNVLTKLFESGECPSWLQANISSVDSVADVGQSEDSKLRASRTSTSPIPLQNAAHYLWRNHGCMPLASSLAPSRDVPKTIGRYRIARVLGSGGFGCVYLAYDEKLKRNVALKVPHVTELKSQIQWDLMLAEAQTVAALDHVGIVPIYDVASADEVPMFLVSKLIEGQTLSQRIVTRTFSPYESVRLVAQVANALQYAHEQVSFIATSNRKTSYRTMRATSIYRILD